MTNLDGSGIRKLAVIGSGTMGNGIAHVAALNGLDVTLVDVSDEALERARRPPSGRTWTGR
jgi:3-hydroxyacyl-CoA dehydrogenase